MESKDDSVVVIGAGLSGSLLACYLAQKGFKVDLFEYRKDMRTEDVSAGRSINLALSERGFNALSKVGLKDEVLKIAIPMSGRRMHARDGTLTYQPYSKDGKSSIWSISRGELNCRMMTLAEKNPNVSISFQKKCVGLNIRTGEATFQDSSSHRSTNHHDEANSHAEDSSAQKPFTVKGKTIIATDGAFSVARRSMQSVPRFDYSQQYLSHGYKELEIPATKDGKHAMDKHCLHIWPRGTFMMIALPNLDGSFTCTCFFPYEGPNGFDSLDGHPDKIEAFFKSEFADVIPLMPTLLHDFQHNPTSALVTIKCFPWSMSSKFCLLGDAAHAIVPFYGQGMNCAFEDCFEFGEMLEKHNLEGSNAQKKGEKEWLALFQEFQNARKPNTDAIAEMAYENFIEMRDRVADPKFLFLSKVLGYLGQNFPDRFLSRYEMISFTRIPYAEAMDFGRTSTGIAQELIKDLNGVEDVQKIDLKKAEELINSRLSGLHKYLSSTSRL